MNISIYNSRFSDIYKDIKIVAAISKSLLEIRDKKGNISVESQYIASTALIRGDIDFNYMFEYLSSLGIENPKLHIFKISLNDCISDEKITTYEQESDLESNSENSDNNTKDNEKLPKRRAQILVYEINLYYFFEFLDIYISKFEGCAESDMETKAPSDGDGNLDSTNFRVSHLKNSNAIQNILPSPIFIFEGISWSNIVLLFKLKGKVINGGTISRRHKLNINQYKLSMFLIYCDLLSSRADFYASYKDSVFNHSKIDKLFYSYDFNFKSAILNDKNLIDSKLLNEPIISQFYYYNLLINVVINRKGFYDFVVAQDTLITENKNRLKCLAEKFLGSCELLGLKRDLSSISDIEALCTSKEVPDFYSFVQNLKVDVDKLALALQQPELNSNAERDKDLIWKVKNIYAPMAREMEKVAIKGQNLDFDLKDSKFWLGKYDSLLNNFPKNIEELKEKIKNEGIHFCYLDPFLHVKEMLDKKRSQWIKIQSLSSSSYNSSEIIKKDSSMIQGNGVNSIRSYSTNSKYCGNILGCTNFAGNAHILNNLSLLSLQRLGNTLKCFSTGHIMYNKITMDQIINSAISRKNQANWEVRDIKRDINNNLIYDKLIRILLDNPHNEITQLKIEQFLLEQSKIILEENLNKAKDINYTKLATYPQFLEILKRKLPLIESLLNQIRVIETSPVKKQKGFNSATSRAVIDPKYYNYKWIELVKNCSNSIIVNLLLGRMLRIICNNSLLNNNTFYTSNAMDIGDYLINQYLYSLYIRSLPFKGSSSLNNYTSSGVTYSSSGPTLVSKVGTQSKKVSGLNSEPYTFSMWKTDNIKLVEEYTDNQLIFHIGSHLLNILMDLELLVIILQNSSNGNKNQQQILALGPIFANIETNSFLTDLSYRVPMIVKPKEWKREILPHRDNKLVERLGGFLNNDVKFTTPLIIENWELKKKSRILDPNVIYKMVNNLQSVPFKINIEVLDFIKKYGIDYDLIIDPNYVHPLERRLADTSLVTQSIKNKHRSNLTYNQRKTLESFFSKKKLESNILGLANVYRYVKEFFIPVRIDNRGRVYCSVDYLNYQSTELAKALLLFSRGNKISKTDPLASNYLKIYGANCFGHKLGKSSFEDRINWVNNNEEKIINLELLREADNKLLFLAFCFEYRKYYEFLNKNCKYYITHLPIQLDATCNGFQHLALLTGDEKLGKYLNLTPSTWYDLPDDFYSFLALSLNEDFKNKQIELNRDIYKLLNQVTKEGGSIFNVPIPQAQAASLVFDTENVKETSELAQPLTDLSDLAQLDSLNNKNPKGSDSKIDSDNKSLQKDTSLPLRTLDQLRVIQSYIPGEIKGSVIKPKEKKVAVDPVTEEGIFNKLKELLNLYDSYSRLANINRKIIKKPTMTKIYNVTLFSMAEYIKQEFNYIEESEVQKENWYEYKGDPNLKIKGRDIYILAKAIDTIIYVKFPKYNQLNEYLKKIAKICVELQIPIPWVLPSGLEVMQSYVTSNEIKLKPFKYRKNTFVLREATETFNTQKQIRALMPNLVHSLDATSLSLLTDMFFNNPIISSPDEAESLNSDNPKNFFAIHDCFATTANYLDTISNYIKTVYFNIYSNKAYIINFDEGIRKNIKLIYGEDILYWENNKWKIRLENKEIDYPDILQIFNEGEYNVGDLRHSSQLSTQYENSLNILDQKSTLTSHLRSKGLDKLANRLEGFYSNILKSTYPID